MPARHSTLDIVNGKVPLLLALLNAVKRAGDIACGELVGTPPGNELQDHWQRDQSMDQKRHSDGQYVQPERSKDVGTLGRRDIGDQKKDANRGQSNDRGGHRHHDLESR